MLKKVLIAIGLVLLLTGIVAGMMLPATAAESKYQVGYARVDVNPYIEDGNFDSGIMALPLRGSGDVWNRLSTKGLVDDNGDVAFRTKGDNNNLFLKLIFLNKVIKCRCIFRFTCFNFYNIAFNLLLNRISASTWEINIDLTFKRSTPDKCAVLEQPSPASNQ